MAVLAIVLLSAGSVPLGLTDGGVADRSGLVTTPLAAFMPAVVASIAVAAVLPRHRDSEWPATRRALIARRWSTILLTALASTGAAVAVLGTGLLAGAEVGAAALVPVRGTLAWAALGVIGSAAFGAGRAWLAICGAVGLVAFYGYTDDLRPHSWNVTSAAADDVACWVLTTLLVGAAVVAVRLAPERSGLA